MVRTPIIRTSRIPLMMAGIAATLWLGTQIPQMASFIYRSTLWVGAAVQTANLHHYHHLSVGHFMVYYPDGQNRAGREVGQIAEQALPREAQSLGVPLPARKIPIILFPSAPSLNVAFGVPAHDNNIGIYWLGTIGVISPHTWHHSHAYQGQSYHAAGPVPHELGHFLLARKALGNYPNWFNEGIAQYQDWRVTGYVGYVSPSLLQQSPYPMAALSQTFYQLPNQALAYREGLSMVQYLVRLKGSGGLRQFLTLLGQQTPFYQAMRSVYGIPNRQTLWKDWHQAALSATR